MTADTKSSPLEQSVKYDYSDLIGGSMEKEVEQGETNA